MKTEHRRSSAMGSPVIADELRFNENQALQINIRRHMERSTFTGTDGSSCQSNSYRMSKIHKTFEKIMFLKINAITMVIVFFDS